MKQKIKITILTLTMVISFFLAFLTLPPARLQRIINRDWTEVKTQYLDLKDIDVLDLNLNYADIEINTGQTPACSLFVTDDADLPITIPMWHFEERTASIKMEKNHQMMSILPEPKKLIKLTLPKQWKGELRLDISTGDLSWTDPLSLTALSVDIGTGDINGSALRADNISLKSSTGSIEISDVVGPADVKTSSGEVNLGFSQLNSDITISTSTGHIELQLPADPSFTADLKCTTGSIEMDIPEFLSSDINSNILFAEIGTGGPRISAKTRTGSITLTSGKKKS